MNRVAAKCDVGMIALVKGTERYTVFYDLNELGRAACLRQLGKWAACKELSFNWYDAAMLSNKVRAVA